MIHALVASAVAALATAGCSASTNDTGSSDEDVSGAVNCADYASPDQSGNCRACTTDGCPSNGCDNGYWCHTTTKKCVKPLSCPVSTTPAIVSSFSTPSTPSDAGLQPVIDAIHGAQTSIRMTMFHLTVTSVVAELAAAAQRGVDVQIIIDQSNWSGHTPQSLKNQLSAGGVKVIPSSSAFRITHEKSFVVDEQTAYIMSLNLTSPFVDTRDYAVVTTDKGVVDEFLLVWQADADNAKNNTANTPTLSNPNLAWSPVNSRDRLTAFVQSATKTLVVSSENLGDPSIQAALIAASAHVDVRVLAPLCDQNADVTFDLPYLSKLNEGGVSARAMPLPAGGAPTADQPYEHAKMMIADGKHAFIGSVNFSTASTTNARELGIFFDDPTAIQMISDAFEHDWAEGVAPPSASDANCPSATAAAALDEEAP